MTATSDDLSNLLDLAVPEIVTVGSLSEVSGPSALVVGVTGARGHRAVANPHAAVTAEVVGLIERLLPLLDADLESDAVVVPAPHGCHRDILILVWLDHEKDAPAVVRLRRAAGDAGRALSNLQYLTIALPTVDDEELSAVIEGVLLGAHRYGGNRRTDAGVPRLRSIEVLSPLHSSPDAPTFARESALATNRTRGLVDAPPNRLYPDSFARLMQTFANSDVDVRVWDEKQLAAEGFGGILGVGQGSEHPPRLVRVDYTPAVEGARHLAIVGKGITFDSGGLNIKTSELDYMNFDMAGAAAAFATVLAVSALKLPVHVTAWLPLAENLPSGQSQRPSDVLVARDGTTVEVRDTDAEGRLVMADAIVAASLERPDILVDVATLTGAQQLALGDRIGALMSNDDALAADLVRLATSADEPLWPMPLPAYMRAELNTRVADIANKGQRRGGMLTAGLFLQDFVERAEVVPRWAHLDICGPAINRDRPYGFSPLGATGVSARTLLGLARELAEQVEPSVS